MTILQVSGLTIRRNTERQVTVAKGMNRWVSTDPEKTFSGIGEIQAGRWIFGETPPFRHRQAGRWIVNQRVVWRASLA